MTSTVGDTAEPTVNMLVHRETPTSCIRAVRLFVHHEST